MINDLMGTQMITTRLIWTVGVVKDHDIKQELVLVKCPPGFFWQCSSIRTIKNGMPIALNCIQHCSHRGRMIGRKSGYRITTEDGF